MALNQLDVLVVGSVNMDLVVTSDRVPGPGETLFGSSFATYPGGKGANQAVAAARMGAATALIGRLGTDPYGQELLNALKAEGILLPLEPRPGLTTGTAVIMVESGGENRIVVIPGANGTLTPEDLDPGLFSRARVVLISQEVPADTVAQALRLGRAHGCMTVLNPAPARELEPDLYPLVDLLVPNRSEAALLTGRSVESSADVRMAADALLRRGVGTVLITLGEQGALAMRENLSEAIPAWPVQAVDTTAAGDAFCGALAAALARGESLLAAAGVATAAAALTVTRPGAQPSLPALAEVLSLMRERR